ncbi:glutathione S-transferase family protein [Defluviimonas sp. WL0050]|uniref:glutathione transferase n=1 Tax=Albidovulum litorale TaxID=2984134 RepID=A0ABT2ZL96_9RHOB|nr:glutathione S-transferase family protein [Defluviimonas sp. WL0050]MCV2871903.1 glutathione S-transferase family protein [Defluviimonas sp. WL0050]
MTPKLTLISHHLCPYVQRVAIALAEKGMDFERIDIDLTNKPDWFLKLSPTGKTPVLVVDGRPIFESSVILEYLEEVGPNPLHPSDVLDRADHRGWMEYGSSILNDIAGLYNAPDASAFAAKIEDLRSKFARVEERLPGGETFDPKGLSLPDAVFAPVFRYFDTLDRIGDVAGLAGQPKLSRWRSALAGRASVRSAVATDYPARLLDFLKRRGSHLSTLLT